jgi:hypothetical protein
MKKLFRSFKAAPGERVEADDGHRVVDAGTQVGRDRRGGDAVAAYSVCLMLLTW